MMADIPKDRIKPGPPLTSVGVDIFGPWEVLTRRTRGGAANIERWGLMFTCLTSIEQLILKLLMKRQALHF
jgi:hypothetical protein